MKKYLALFLLMTACVPAEEVPFLDYDERVTIETLHQVEAVLGVYSDTTDTFVSKFITLKINNGGAEQVLVASDTIPVSEFISGNGWSNYNSPFRGEVYFFFENYIYNQNELKVLVSGQIKKPHPKDKIPGKPIFIEKIETISPCPVSYTKLEGKVPLQGTIWKWQGFLNGLNQIYSFPSCENPLVTFQLTDRLVTIHQGYINPMRPNAMYLELSSGFFFVNVFGTLPIYEIEGNHLNLYNTMWYGPNRHPNAPHYFTTRQTAEKADSLKLLFLTGNLQEPEAVDFVVAGNQLILSHRKTKLRALFFAHQ
jgi:hypothetical protein